MAPSPTDTAAAPDPEFLQRIRHIFLEEAELVAQLLHSTPNAQLLGETEFRLRDAVHRAGARALEAALDGRKKGGTKARA